jgi:hypothetical protein
LKSHYLLLLVIYVLTTSCNAKKEEQTLKLEKINGLSFVASRDEVFEKDVADLKAFHANHTAVIPYGFMRDLSSPNIKYNTDRQWWGERVEGVEQTIDLFHNGGVQVMLKPQIWIHRGEYTGHIALESEAQWKQLEDSYRTFILDFAKIAAQRKTAMLCIATELDSFVKERPEYWKNLIAEIRSIYKGKLTYAANWDSYKNISFWDDLDYIGVDAYFPLSEEKTPCLQTINDSWTKWKLEMSTLSRKHNKPLLLTEYGYISADYAGKEPWKSASPDQEINEEAQKILLQALYHNLWEEEWIAGGFLWKHFPEQFYQREGGFERLFNVQKKQAETTVKEAYQKG